MRSMNIDKHQELMETVERSSDHNAGRTLADRGKEAIQTLPNYTLYTSNRKNRVGGGVAMYCKTSLTTKSISRYISTTVSSLWINLQRDDKLPAIIYGVVYYPGSFTAAQKSDVIDHLHDTISGFLHKFKNAEIFLHGDFNALDVSPIGPTFKREFRSRPRTHKC